MTLSPATLYGYLVLNAIGRENAVGAKETSRHFGCRERQIRAIIPELEEEYGVVVLASYDPLTGGYYLPRNPGELEEGLRELHSHAISEIQHYNTKVRNGERMFGENVQLSLLGEVV